MNPNGRDAVVQAKITSDGKLGRVEVIDGGTLYDDSDSPILLTFVPPVPLIGDDEAGNLDPNLNGQVELNGLLAGQPVDEGNEISAVTGGEIELADAAVYINTKYCQKRRRCFLF